MAWVIFDWAVPVLLVLAPAFIEAIVRVFFNVLAHVLERPALASRPWTSFIKLLEEECCSILGQSFAGFFRRFSILLARFGHAHLLDKRGNSG